MANWKDPDWLLGRRFGCSFRVIGFRPIPAGGQPEDRRAVLRLRGEKYELSLGELRTLIERGLVVEEES